MSDTVCGNCLNITPAFDKTVVGFEYAYPVTELIKQFKYSDRSELAIYFAKIIRTKLKLNNKPDIILPVPLHKNRLVSRGFNQSLLLAKEIAKPLQIKLEPSLCKRIIDTAPQSLLSNAKRKTNIRGAFQLTNKKLPNHIAIVDDVITTGSTTSELASLLKQAGCKQVEVWAIART